MKFGYITFSTEEQQLVHDVIKQMSQGAIDELGLGKIRDAFSDEMFPGMSTLHRKSKYFVLLPTLYNQLSQTDIKEPSSIPNLIRQWEINLTIQLLNGVDNAENKGITGSSLSMDDLRDGKYVKVTPTSIYLSSLKYFGLVDGQIGLVDLIYQQSIKNKESALKIKRTKDDIAEDPDGSDTNMGSSQYFFSFPGYNIDKGTAINLTLTEYESKILKERISKHCKYDDGRIKLYGYILMNNKIDIKDDFFDMKEIIDNFPKEYDYLKKTYYLASQFSKWAHLMNTYYRLAFFRKVNNENKTSLLEKHINEILLNRDYPPKEQIEDILNHIRLSKDFIDNNHLCDFCRKASNLLYKQQKEGDLIALIDQREKEIKGNHHKIGNDRYKNTDFNGNPGYFTYRWNDIAYSMIYDIRNPQK